MTQSPWLSQCCSERLWGHGSELAPKWLQGYPTILNDYIGNFQFTTWKLLFFIHHYLVGGWASPLKHISQWSMGRIISCIRENKKCSKPQTSYPFGSAGQPVSSPWSGSSRHAVHFGIHSGIIPCVETSNQLIYILWWWSILYRYIYIYILLIALASFCVRGHSYPGSICRILGTIYRISGYIIYNHHHHHNITIIMVIIMLYIHMAIYYYSCISCSLNDNNSPKLK